MPRQIMTVCLLVLFISPAIASKETTVTPIPEVYRTQQWSSADVDSLALWRGPEGQAWLYVTGKQSHEVYVCDGLTGELLQKLGGPGTRLGQFNRPNGIAVLGDYLLVVERDNRRVQVLALPSHEPVLSFGQDVLVTPYGIGFYEHDEVFEIYVTDDFTPDWYTKRLDGTLSGKRIKQFRFAPGGEAPQVTFVRAFGHLEGPASLESVESILVDPVLENIFVCDEPNRFLRVFDLEGNFKNQTIGVGIIQDDPEGIALVNHPEDDSAGYLILSDQGAEITRLRIFTRDGSRLLGTVSGDPVLANTDGITFSQGDLGEIFKGGALYCIHDDIGVQGYSWEDIKTAVEETEE